MIYEQDVHGDFTTFWHVPPPLPGSRYIVTISEWALDGRSRHVYHWRYPDLPQPDTDGWRSVPSWWREMT